MEIKNWRALTVPALVGLALQNKEIRDAALSLGKKLVKQAKPLAEKYAKKAIK